MSEQRFTVARVAPMRHAASACAALEPPKLVRRRTRSTLATTHPAYHLNHNRTLLLWATSAAARSRRRRSFAAERAIQCDDCFGDRLTGSSRLTRPRRTLRSLDAGLTPPLLCLAGSATSCRVMGTPVSAPRFVVWSYDARAELSPAVAARR